MLIHIYIHKKNYGVASVTTEPLLTKTQKLKWLQTQLVTKLINSTYETPQYLNSNLPQKLKLNQIVTTLNNSNVLR